MADKIKEVEVAVLKKRKRTEVSQARQFRNQVKQAVKRKKGSSKLVFTRAEKFVKKEMKIRRDKRRLLQNRKNIVEVSKPDEDVEKQDTSPPLAFVVRLANIKIPMASASKQALKSLRLDFKNQGTFILMTPEVKKALKIAEAYITWGEPSLRTVRDLLFKRGFLKGSSASGKPIPLMDNTLIEKHLGQHGVICIEDVVHELYSRGPHFHDVNAFVGKFTLSDPAREEKEEKKKFFHVDAGGSYGYRGDKINALVQTMI